MRLQYNNKKIAQAFLGISIFLILGGASPSTQPSPSGLVNLLPSPLPSGQLSIAPLDSKSLMKEFIRAQKTEIKALEHRHKFEMKELKASQATRLNEWNKKEQEARHKFFAEHSKGAERRVFVKDFIDRRDTFRKMLQDERNQRTHEQESRLNAIKQDHTLKLQDFKKALEEGKIPSSSLWPQSGI